MVYIWTNEDKDNMVLKEIGFNPIETISGKDTRLAEGFFPHLWTCVGIG